MHWKKESVGVPTVAWRKVIHFCISCLESWDDNFVGFQRCNHNVEYPEEDKKSRRGSLGGFGTSKLSANGWITANHQDENSNNGLDTKYRYRETQAVNRKKMVLRKSFLWINIFDININSNKKIYFESLFRTFLLYLAGSTSKAFPCASQ